MNRNGRLLIRDALEDFYISKHSARMSPLTLQHYTYHLGCFQKWCIREQISNVSDLSQNTIGGYLAAQAEDGKLSAYTLHGRARTLRTFVGFLYEERLLPTILKVLKPKLPQKPPPERERATSQSHHQAPSKAKAGPRDDDAQGGKRPYMSFPTGYITSNGHHPGGSDARAVPLLQVLAQTNARGADLLRADQMLRKETAG